MGEMMQQSNLSLVLEKERLATLANYQIMDTPPEKGFDRIARLAAGVFEVPVAAISFIDDRRQWHKSSVGIDAKEVPRETALCSFILENQGAVVAEDAINDERFSDSPLVTRAPHIKFYAGCPLVAPNNMVLGSLWIGDMEERPRLSDDELDQLRSMADIVMSELELRREIQQRQEAQLDAAEARTDLELALALSSTASWKLNLSSDEVSWGGAYCEVWGEDADEALTTGEDTFARIHPKDRQKIREALSDTSLEKNQSFSETFRIILPSGEVRWLSGRGNFFRNHGDDAVTGISYDITDSVRQEEQQKLHTRELHHRLRNLFATLQSIMALTRNSATSIDDYIERISGRLGALNRTQQILLDSDFVTGSFASLVNDLCAIYPRLTWTGPDVSLPENAMVAISLVLNELATNAAKYGGLKNASGSVKISWVIDYEGKSPVLSLTWIERGGPLLHTTPIPKGFGSSLIRQSITRNLNGKIVKDWQKEGLVCSISFPLPSRE
ncbi:HWE histidine kinase domain-containing protein [Parasphingorhabdus sp. JC815]|uniref:sensor histidine kinase n=1 Tax=Parasphingorhabdus sp. JC815 TaxID=3232140 RepID=UPI00345A3A86